jgi:phosphoribosylaminoimidazolecarboxamide formyltransferase/IMP cyclohydrolase
MKHLNAAGASCGLGSDASLVTRKMLAGDPPAIFGGVVAVNYIVDSAIAEILLDTAREDPECHGKDRFLEVIAAPAFTPEALALLRSKGNLRLLVNEALAEPTIDMSQNWVKLRGKMLVEDRNTQVVTPDVWEQVTSKKVTGEFNQEQNLAGAFVWAICKSSKSNTITLAAYEIDELYGLVIWIVGNGVGQQSRVACCQLASGKAGNLAKGAVAASDALFPATDGPEVLIDAGIVACVSISGSIKDKEVIATFEKAGVPLVFHNLRGFLH